MMNLAGPLIYSFKYYINRTREIYSA